MSLVTERCNNSSNCLYGSLVTVRRIQCPVIIMNLHLKRHEGSVLMKQESGEVSRGKSSTVHERGKTRF